MTATSTSLEIKIRPMGSADYEMISKIYQQGIDTKNATFETKAPDWDSFNGKFLDFAKSVAVMNEQVVGWAALSAVSSRCVYSGVCEVSVYVDEAKRGLGIGSKLLRHLITLSEQNQVWTLQAGIFPENKSSVKIHIDNGFRVVGYREKIGRMDGVWRDTLLLERRSALGQFS